MIGNFRVWENLTLTVLVLSEASIERRYGMGFDLVRPYHISRSSSRYVGCVI